MLNHARTLLMNVDGENPPRFYTPGDEAIEPTYIALESLPSYVQTLRTLLFGGDPDRAMLNYRCRQLLAVVHASPLAAFITNLDARLTYDWEDNTLLDPTLYVPRVRQLAGSTADRLSVLGSPAPPDAGGRLYHLLQISGVDETHVRVQHLTPPLQDVTSAVSWTDGLSTQLSLLSTGYQFRLATANPQQEWHVEVYNRPQLGLIDLLAGLDNSGDTVLSQLFGVSAVEPYATLRNLWYRQDESVRRLAAIVVALVLRLEERRVRT